MTDSSIDMSITIGGRTVTPAFPVVDASLSSPIELAFDASLKQYSDEHIPLESTEGIQRRERVLNRMGELCRDWIKSVCKKQNLPSESVETAGGQLYTSGSYRLGVHEPGADIDTILVAPNMCTRFDFFGTLIEQSDGTMVRDPQSLAERIRHHSDVTNFVPVEGAAVPILTFDWEGVNIDLLFARLHSTSVPASLDINNDHVLDGVDSATEKSLNGPRVTNLIAALVSGTPERYQTFLQVVRCVRKWAKARGLYSNKMGYWGGVNINISVALVVQLYPRASAASLLRKFFLVFKSWRWPNPVLLTKPHDAGLGLPVWAAHTTRAVAPIITPAYPAMNSTLAVSRQTLQIMHEEFCRGHEIVDKLWKQQQQPSGNPLDWAELFEQSDFFIAYPHYLSLCIVGPSQEDVQAWAGFVESRMRKLVSDRLGRSLPLSKIQLWPKKLPVCIADKAAPLTAAQRKNCLTYFVGFRVDVLRMKGSQLNIEQQLQHFREWELAPYNQLVPGMDLLVQVFKVKELPKVCFEDIYKDGKAEAMKKRRRILDNDPKRQERKRQARLRELKEKMSEIQRQKEDRKRKLEEVESAESNDGESNDKTMTKVKLEEDSPAELVSEEADLLENVLDNIQQDAGETKTREEAEADRRRLLAGELLEEGAAAEDDELATDYMDDGARYSFAASNTAAANGPMTGPKEEEVVSSESAVENDVLKRIASYLRAGDGAVATIGGNMLAPERRPDKFLVDIPKMKIVFRRKFDVVELDANGHVIDKGDADFQPSQTWTGRRGGFEFKLGERGLGYYRTGKKVVVPSNTAY